MQADAVISFPLFTRTHALATHVYTSLSKHGPKASKGSHGSLEVHPTLKSLALNLWGVAEISTCAAHLLQGLWTLSPPKHAVSSQSAAAHLMLRQPAAEDNLRGVTCWEWQTVEQGIWGISEPPALSNRTLLCISYCNSTIENAHGWRWFCSPYCYQPSAVLPKLSAWLYWDMNNTTSEKKKTQQNKRRKQPEKKK